MCAREGMVFPVVVAGRVQISLHLSEVSFFQAFQSFRLFGTHIDHSWDQCKSDEKILGQSPSTPPPTLSEPKSLRIYYFKVSIFQNFLGEDPHTPLTYKDATFMHVALLAVLLDLATTLCAFQDFLSSARLTPDLYLRFIRHQFSANPKCNRKHHYADMAM